MGHAGRLTRNCKLDREGSSTAIPVTLLCTLRHDGCWAFAALNNQNRIRSAVARIGPQFPAHLKFNAICSVVVARPVYPRSIFIVPFGNFSNISEISVSASWQRKMNVNLENFGVEERYTGGNIRGRIIIIRHRARRFWMPRMNMRSVTKILQKFNFFLLFDNFFFSIFLTKLCDNGLCMMIIIFF